MLGFRISHGDLNWPSDEGTVTNYVTHNFTANHGRKPGFGTKKNKKHGLWRWSCFLKIVVMARIRATFLSRPLAKFSPTKRLLAQRVLSSLAGVSKGCFSVMTVADCSCRETILELARCGLSLRRRTRAFLPLHLAVKSKAFSCTW